MDKQKRQVEKIIQSLLETSAMSMEKYLAARKQVKEEGIEKIFDETLNEIKNKRAKMSFREHSLLGFDGLSKQRSFTLEEKRAQAMWVRYGKPGETIEIYLEKYRRGEFDFYYKLI